MSKARASAPSTVSVARRWTRGGAAVCGALLLFGLQIPTSAVAGGQPAGRAAAQPVVTSSLQPVVRTQAGSIRGSQAGGARQFLGVPYARPPVGELRWANPVAPALWKGVRDATDYDSPCPQTSFGDFAFPSTNEDCLYLNVYAPQRGSRRPVMVWLHGGGSAGHGNGYDGSALAREQNVVVVTVNHRIGALGSLVHPALDGQGATTLYELRDQQFALMWVKRNIAAFGGDPRNVTLFGESIGGANIQTQMVSPTARGLFHKAIFQSGPSSYYTPLTPLSEAEALGKAFATALGCADQTAQCLRKASVEAILKAQRSVPGGCCFTFPVNDGHLLTSSVYDAVRSGRFNRVPIFDITNRDEYTWFVAFEEVARGRAITLDEYPAELRTSFGADAAAVQAAYPLSAFNSPSEALAAAQGDRMYPCQVRNFDVDASKYVRVYAAEFNDADSPEVILPPVSFPYRAAHTHEIPYIFPGWSGASRRPPPPLTPQQQKLAREMRKLWATFAQTGILPGYPALTRDRQPVISLQTPKLEVIADFNAVHKCELWNSIRKWTPVQ